MQPSSHNVLITGGARGIGLALSVLVNNAGVQFTRELSDLSPEARRTGRAYESDFVHVIRFRDGMIVRFQEFFDTYAAGEAFRVDGA